MPPATFTDGTMETGATEKVTTHRHRPPKAALDVKWGQTLPDRLFVQLACQYKPGHSTARCGTGRTFAECFCPEKRSPHNGDQTKAAANPVSLTTALHSRVALCFHQASGGDAVAKPYGHNAHLPTLRKVEDVSFEGLRAMVHSLSCTDGSGEITRVRIYSEKAAC